MKLISIMWLAVMLAVMVCVNNYASTPGPVGSIRAQWPEASQIPLDLQRPTLVMFVHPQCPCTRASLGELEVLMARGQGKLRAHVVFLKPIGMTEDWVNSDLRRTAAGIPGVTVSVDEAGTECHLFQAGTSGETMLYSPQGRLLFHGGITLARGHAGDNPGRSALESFLFARPPAGSTQTPVFGCPLFETTCTEGGVCKP